MNRDTGIVVGEDGIVLRTTDGGESWDIRKMDEYIGIYLDIFVLSEITFTDSKNGWTVGGGYYGNELYRTTDAGETWHWNELIIWPKYYAGIVDICFTDEKHGFIIGDYEGFFAKTTDGGITWEQQNLIEKYPEIGNNPFYCTTLAFTDSLNGWIIGGSYFNNHILKTTDGCESWEEVNVDGIGNRWLYKIRLSEQLNRNTGWIVGGYGGIFKKSGESENWIEQSDEMLSFSSVHFINEYFGCAVGLEKIYTTEDGGNTWVNRIQSDSLELWDVKITDNQNILVVGAKVESTFSRKGVVLHSPNGGTDWNRITFDTLSTFKSITKVNNSIWISSIKALLKSTNDGNSWEIVSSNLDAYPDYVQFINENVGWGLMMRGYNMFKTIDGGKNWVIQRVDSSINLSSLYFLDANIGFTVSDSPGKNIFRTTDGGNTWESYSIPLTYLNTVHFTDSLTGWAAGTYNRYPNYRSQIVKTTDGGNSWIEQESPLIDGLTDLFFIDKNIGWGVGSSGIIKTINGGNIVSAVDEYENYNNIPEAFYLYQNYPNPFNPSTIISYQIFKEDFISLKVYDIIGREITSLFNGYQQKGHYIITFDALTLASGIYFYRLTSNGLSITRKMILLR
jgi:photosystem II stability/assembly factor-like uncharacterized protein